MITEIGIIFVIVAIIGLIFHYLKQPMVPAYILAGIIAGPLALGLISQAGAISELSEMAFVVMLFVIGIEMDLRRLEKIGLVAIFGGILQVVVTFAVGWIFGYLMGEKHITCAYVGLILAFSSTMLVVKILGDKHDLETLYGRVAVGILVMQDILAIFALAILSSGSFSLSQTISTITLTAGIILLVVFVAGEYLLPRLFDIIASDREMLFCISLGLLFIVGFYAQSQKLTLGIGSFLIGLAMSNSAYRYEIIGDLKALKSFFAVLFFASLGLQMVPADILTHGGSVYITMIIFYHVVIAKIWFILGLILLAMIIKPLITMTIVAALGYERGTACRVGISLGQLSEFGLVLTMYGVAQYMLDANILLIVIIATIITITTSTYAIQFSHDVFSALKGYTGWLGKISWLKESPYQFQPNAENCYEVAIIGHDKLGGMIAEALGSRGKKYLVVDSNPAVIPELQKKNVPYLFGDVTCSEILSQLDLGKIKTIFSSLPDAKDNALLLEHLKRNNPDTNLIGIVNSCDKAGTLYRAGFHYVLITFFLAAHSLLGDDSNYGDLDTLLSLSQDDLKKMGLCHLEKLCAKGECVL
jgi:Kef-type K+ transport system membrane component KefB